MNKIIARKRISANLVKLQIRTSVATKAFRPGQYIVLKSEENEQGTPSIVLKADKEKEILTALIPVTDKRAEKLVSLNEGNFIAHAEGPLGLPVEIKNFGTIICVGRGSGIVALLPVLTALAQTGNHIKTILSASNRDGIMLEDEIRSVSNELICLTDDGSYGEKQTVLQKIESLIRTNKFAQLIAFGSAQTMKECNSAAIKYNINPQTFLHLSKTGNTKLSGTFKVTVCDCAQAICVDGYNFNAFYPNFDELMRRFGKEEFSGNYLSREIIEAAVHV